MATSPKGSDGTRTITLTAAQAALLAEVVDEMIDVDFENVAARELHTAKEIDLFKREIEALRAIRAPALAARRRTRPGASLRGRRIGAAVIAKAGLRERGFRPGRAIRGQPLSGAWSMYSSTMNGMDPS